MLIYAKKRECYNAEAAAKEKLDGHLENMLKGRNETFTRRMTHFLPFLAA